jgi:hypothetical protein
MDEVQPTKSALAAEASVRLATEVAIRVFTRGSFSRPRRVL